MILDPSDLSHVDLAQFSGCRAEAMFLDGRSITGTLLVTAVGATIGPYLLTHDTRGLAFFTLLNIDERTADAGVA